MQLLDYKGIIWEYPGKTKPDKLLHIREIISKKIDLIDHFTLDTFIYYVSTSKKNGLISLIQEYDNEIYVWRPTFDDLFYPLLVDYEIHREILHKINIAIKSNDTNFDVMELVGQYSFVEEYEGSYWFLKRGFKCDGPRGVLPAYAIYTVIHYIMLREEQKFYYGDGSERVIKAFEDFISVYITKTMSFKKWLNKHRPTRKFDPKVPPFVELP
jgi:hypothetical protein